MSAPIQLAEPTADPVHTRRRWLTLCLPCGAVLTATALLLHLAGRPWWCSCGQGWPWVSNPQGAHTSQHLLDPYSFIHLLHGLLFYWGFAWAFPRLAAIWRFTLAIIVEACWELLENSSFVIERYRAATAAVGYQGDTISNSLGDILCCALGLILAPRLGWRGSAILFVVMELLLLVFIRDSLLLTTFMLVFPSDALKNWQTGG